MSTDARSVVVAFVQAVNDGDAPAIDALLHPDFVDHTPGPAQEAGADAFVGQKLSDLRVAFPDLDLRIEDTIVEGDRIAWRWTLRGTNLGEFAGRPATGKTVEFPGLNAERIEEGTIVEHWSIYDTATLLDQLGLFQFSPAP